jgi:hypothetical protein
MKSDVDVASARIQKANPRRVMGQTIPSRFPLPEGRVGAKSKSREKPAVASKVSSGARSEPRIPSGVTVGKISLSKSNSKPKSNSKKSDDGFGAVDAGEGWGDDNGNQGWGDDGGDDWGAVPVVEVDNQEQEAFRQELERERLAAISKRRAPKLAAATAAAVALVRSKTHGHRVAKAKKPSSAPKGRVWSRAEINRDKNDFILECEAMIRKNPPLLPSIDEDCPICFDSLMSGGIPLLAETEDEKGITHRCVHCYHPLCIQQYLDIQQSRKETRNMSSRCPQCRGKIKKYTMSRIMKAALDQGYVRPPMEKHEEALLGELALDDEKLALQDDIQAAYINIVELATDPAIVHRATAIVQSEDRLGEKLSQLYEILAPLTARLRRW